MLKSRLDGILGDKIAHLIGVESDQVKLPLNLISLACFFVLSEREGAIKKFLIEEDDRLNDETFFDSLTELGINVDGSVITAFNNLIKIGYISVDPDGKYSPSQTTLAFTGIINKLFPKMPGTYLVSYFIQILDEIRTKRKKEEDALLDVDQTLASHGNQLELASLNLEEKKFLKKVVSKKKPEGSKKLATIRQRGSKRAKMLNVLSLRMKKMGDLPSLSYNDNTLQKIFELDERVISKIIDISITDVSIVSNLLKLANENPKFRSENAISTVTQALMELGYDDARKVLRDFTSMEDFKSHKIVKPVERAFQFSYLSSIIAAELCNQLKIDGIEEISICSMYFHFGQIIIMFYLPEAYIQIMSLVERNLLDKNSATRDIIGMTFENVGVKIATDWKLPFHIIESMKVTSTKEIGKARSALLLNMPYYVNDIILAVGQDFKGKGATRLRNLIDNLHIPKNEIITIFELGWSKLFEYTTTKKYDINRNDFLASIVQHYS